MTAMLKCIFQSTHPLRDATKNTFNFNGNVEISIHAPLTGCDLILKEPIRLTLHYFNPRTPYGMRLTSSAYLLRAVVFQSTHPLRDATGCETNVSSSNCISIHAPLTGCDIQQEDLRQVLRNISIHAPLTGCDMAMQTDTDLCNISIHAPLTGCDHASTSQ